ncbi:MAG TPA: DUF808 domain-containing protein [Rhodospirillaceae bacterium]|nr:ABC transporter [Alphaproteobacteria bacterium]OUT40960.1 MAG: ABC transporter [Micavibrio sp. TMED2]HCI47031.1 DUF808 domain-containing protein [Rhodospirillaceae bacterium]MAS47554.1 ABC transporter [Alphaproteobacteria bacterium]MAX96573.1 ABC transporter [Alphaproteobacteria bacterium]|tara:strand:- start:10827 stop:11801 length:975 start_codon:yes stop_codon:yes gene_type:complete
MSGLLALLDDVAALTKVAATQVDDVVGHAAKVSSKTVGVVVDDAAVTPKYVHGLPAARELPIVMAIARGSIINKLVILLPLAMLLSAFAPWVLTPLLMLGGCYLCFEGAEKVLHVFLPHHEEHEKPKTLDAAHLEKRRVSNAIKTDFILSAEIMVIALSAIESENIWLRGIILAVVAVGITALVYGTVALLVKADDIGLKLSQIGRLAVTRKFGLGLVKGMPGFMKALTIIGTAAMLWVGGSIIIHGLEVLGLDIIGHTIHDLAHAAGHAVPVIEAALSWAVTATLDGLFGLLVGAVIIPVVGVVMALVSRLRGYKQSPVDTKS